MPSLAGLRTPGQYAGIPIFDRWNGCILYSGVFLMYVSEKTKEGLRPYAGKPVLIEAKEVNQPINPGDGLIGKFDYLGDPKESRLNFEGLQLISSVLDDGYGRSLAIITVRNTGKEPLLVRSEELAPTLLMKKSEKYSDFVSDGPSFATITRQSIFRIGPVGPDQKPNPFTWDLAVRRTLTLSPGESHEFAIRFNLPDGEYDFLCGYGGGVHAEQGVASNLAGFNVTGGKLSAVVLRLQTIPPLRIP
jgi:hypothetical protein